MWIRQKVCLDALSEWWTVKPKRQVTKIQWQTLSKAWQLVKNASGRRAAEVFIKTTEEHKVLRPIKRAEIHESHTVTEKGSIAWETWSYRASWRGRACTKIRDAPAEKRRESKVQRSSTKERILAASAAHCTVQAILCFFSLESLRSPRIEHWGQLPHLMNNGRKISIMRRTSCSSLSRVLSTRSSCSTSPAVSYIVIGGLKILFCVQQQYEVRIWVNKHKETCCKTSHRTTNKHGETRYRLNCHEKGVTGKNSHSLPERPKFRNAGGPELLGLHARDAQVKPYLEQQNLGRMITAEHKVLIETCESGNNHRYAVVGQNLAAERSLMKQNYLELGWQAKSNLHWQFLGVWHKSVKLTMELLKSIRRHFTVQN